MSSIVIDRPPQARRQHSQGENVVEAAEADAPNETVVHQIEETAGEVHGAAEDAAKVAKSKGAALTGEPAAAAKMHTAQKEARAKTEAAVAEGKRDVQAVKEQGADYVEQVKHMASSAVETAQTYLPTSLGGKEAEGREGSQTTAVQTGKEYIASGQQAAKPHVEKAKGVVQGAFGTAGVQPDRELPASGSGIPATSAPLESGAHTTDTPYPTTTTKTGTQNIAEIGRSKGSKQQ